MSKTMSKTMSKIQTGKFWRSLLCISISPLLFMVLIISWNYLAESPIDAQAFKLPKIIDAGPYAELKAKPITEGLALPEAIVIGGKGELYIGTADGLIWKQQNNIITKFAAVGGYPIGLDIDNTTGILYAANYPLGLQSILPDGTVTTLLTAVDGIDLAFADDLVISESGIIYISDASTKYNLSHFKDSDPVVLWDFLEGQANGRVVSYDLKTGLGTTVLEDLYFPSGLSLLDHQLYIIEVSKNRLVRYGLTGEHRNVAEIVSSGFPGVPDDVFIDENKRIWISLVSPRDDFFDEYLVPYPWLRQLMARLPNHLLNGLGLADQGGSVLMLEMPDGNADPKILGLDLNAKITCQFFIKPDIAVANLHIRNDELILAVLSGDTVWHSQTTPCSHPN